MALARLILVDDEADYRRIFGDLLKKEGYAIRTCASAKEAFAACVESPPDLLLSDVSMPEEDGLSLLSRLRAEKKTRHVPVILMSGVRKDAEEQAEGLDSGADDYLPKPVEPKLLRSKIAAVLRRFSTSPELGDVLKAQGLVLDAAARTVALGGKPVSLTRKEFDLIAAFLRKPGRLLSIPYLLETVWGYDPADYSDPHTVAAHMSTLRKKIGTKLGAKITAVPGLGYRFDP